MLTMTSKLHDYVVENAKIFNEFDRSNFISNASVALNKEFAKLSISVNDNQYSNILVKTISHINNIEIDSYVISEFISKILGSGRVDSMKMMMKDITKVDNIVLKPQYLSEAIGEYREVINGIVSGKYDTTKIKSFYNNVDSYVDTLKKRLVSSNININITPKEMLKYDIQDKVVVSTKYLEDRVIPFLQEFLKKKKELANEIYVVKTVVSSISDDIRRMLDNINDGIELDKFNDMQKKLVLNYTYNQLRAIMEGVSFITYATIRKAHQFEECVVECQNVYNMLTLTFHDSMNIIESGAFDTKVITATDANNMAEKLADGSNDVFDELAKNILQYHKGYISTHLPSDIDVSAGDAESYVTTLLSNNEYNLDIYEDLIKAYIEIGNGLDIVAKHTDSMMVVADEVLQKAGFIISLTDRFHNEIESLDDLSMYGLTDLNIGNDGEKTECYYKILSEIANYPNLTGRIATAIKEVNIKAEYVESLFTARSNGELGMSETINELKIFFVAFKEQFRLLNCEVSRGLYARLKNLASKADACLNNVTNIEGSYDDNIDFFEEAVIANLEENDTINDIVMESLLKQYYAEREFKERGVRLIYEADESTSVKVIDNASTQTEPQETKSASTTSTTSTASTGGTKDKISNLLKSISEWFEKMIQSFEDVIGRQKAKNTKWLAENKERLMTRSYSNVEIQVLPYDKMPNRKVVEDISKMVNNVNAMTVQNMQSVNSYEDMRSKLINFGPKFAGDDDKVAITTYYKVGTLPLQTVSYANNAIKTLVVNEMIPYCEGFYGSYYEDIKKQLTALKTSIENIHKTHITESVSDCVCEGRIFSEAGTNNTNDPQTTQKTNTSTKTGWVKQCVQMYSGCVLNAIRDRNNDYFKVLSALVPKA